MFFVGRGNRPGVPAGQRSAVRLPVFGDQVAELLVDRDQRVALHLVVDVAQIRGAVGVGDEAVARSRSASVTRSPQRIRIIVISR